MLRTTGLLICCLWGMGPTSVAAQEGSWSCTALCDGSFWQANPSVAEVEAEAGLFTRFAVSDKWRFTPLHWAARHAEADVVQLLVDKGLRVNALASDGTTPLMLAARRGRADIARVLLGAGADVTLAGGSSLVTALHQAAYVGSLETVTLLVEAGADPNRKGSRGMTPLQRAMRHDDLRVARHLIHNGADVAQPQLLFEAVFFGSTEAVLLLLEAGVDPRADIGTSTGLHGFGARGEMAALNALLAAGAEINARDPNGRTPIFNGLTFADPAIIARMIEVGADPTIPDDTGLTALQFAMSRDHPLSETIALVVAAGADPNLRRANGNTPLHIVAERGAAENAKALVDAGAEIDARDADGATPLLVALRSGQAETARTLVALGANMDITGFAGRGPLFYAASSENPALLADILATNPNVNARDDGNATPLMLASATGPAALIAQLIAAGAEVNAADDHGWTPLHYAARYGDGPIVRSLIEAGADPALKDAEGRLPSSIGFNNRAIRGYPADYRLLSQ